MTSAQAFERDAELATEAATTPSPGAPESAIWRREREQLLPLTSLRFMAAAMVVFGHSRGAFGLTTEAGGAAFRWWLAVPFFFVLSGFILAYAYPRLDGPGTRRFLISRLARLWPAHAATLALMLLVSVINHADVSLSAGLANLAMLHAWVPYPRSYFSFNSPSWSISTEFGLYLLFPFLIRDLRRTWLPKLALAIALYMVLYHISVALHLPLAAPTGPGADRTGVLLSPLAYVHLFLLGMTTRLVWQWLEPRIRLGTFPATALEIAALGGAAWTIFNKTSSQLAVHWLFPSLEDRLLRWVPDLDGHVLSFAALILVMALRRGLLSRALSWPLLVLLGELSFSLYLAHLPVRVCLDVILSRFASLGAWWHTTPGLTTAAIYWSTSLLAAWALWRFVECPARNWTRTWWAKHEASSSGRRWSASVATAAALATLVLAVHVARLY